jgi:hypothetical protein
LHGLVAWIGLLNTEFLIEVNEYLPPSPSSSSSVQYHCATYLAKILTSLEEIIDWG